MTGMKPAHEQSFDFDDYAYAQAPGSHGGGIDGENAFVHPRYVFNHRKRSILKIRGLIYSDVWRERFSMMMMTTTKIESLMFFLSF